LSWFALAITATRAFRHLPLGVSSLFILPASSVLLPSFTQHTLFFGTPVIVNGVLRVMMKFLVDFERHSSVSARDSALTWKLFSAEFLNTAILALIVFAQSDFAINMGFKKFVPFENGEFQGVPPRWEQQSLLFSSLSLVVLL
jgi:hypothetical protein